MTPVKGTTAATPDGGRLALASGAGLTVQARKIGIGQAAFAAVGLRQSPMLEP